MNPFSLAALLTVTNAQAADKQRVLEALSGYEETASPAELKALGDDVADTLIEIAQDEALPRSRRARAVHALGWFKSEQSRSFLVGQLSGSDRLLARKATYALGNGWGDEALDDLQAALDHDDVQLRLAAVRSLDRIGSSAADQRLKARLANEQDATVTRTIDKALK